MNNEHPFPRVSGYQRVNDIMGADMTKCRVYSPPSINVTPISANPLYMLIFFYSTHIAHYKC